MTIRLRLSMLSLFILCNLSVNVRAEQHFNLDFIKGDARNNVPAIFDGHQKYPAGKYLLSVAFNNDNLGQHVMEITEQDREYLCLPEEWISTVNLPLKIDLFSAYRNVERQCYEVGRFPDAQVNFDYGNQALTFSIPQIAVRDQLSIDNWDYGIPGFRLSYSGNASKTDTQQEQLYGNFNLNANLGRWVLSGVTSGFKGEGFTTQEATLSTAVGQARGVFLVGKSQVNTSKLPGFSFYGAAMQSDRNMTPWELRGYAPVISGVASSNARITVKQNGYILSSQIVPPGAYSLNNIRPSGNGELTVTVEEENGATTVRSYPITTLPSLLRNGEYNYNVASGRRTNSEGKRALPGIFTLLQGDYGFESVTFDASSILHNKYQSIGAGLTKDIGILGALSSGINLARSTYDANAIRQGKSYNGTSVMVQYAKGLGEKTNLQLLGYRYTGKNYVDFSNFEPDNEIIDDRKKHRYEAIVTQNVGSGFLSASGWLQTYRDQQRDSGVNLSYSTQVNQVSLSLNASYGKYHAATQDDYSTSLSISIPFSAFSRPHYSTSSFSYMRGTGASFNTGVSGNINERVNYSLSTGANKNTASASAYAGIGFDPVQTSMSISQSRNKTSMSVSASGSVIATQPTGLLFVRQQNTTLAVVKLRDIEGIRFNGSTPTNRKGNTAINLTPYTMNSIRIHTDNLPDNIELKDSVYNIVPTNQAIVYRDFNYEDIKRYILRIADKNGQPLIAGSQAKTEQGVEAGFVTNGGILLANTLSAPQTLIIRQQNGQTCNINMTGIQPGENTIKGVRCE